MPKYISFEINNTTHYLSFTENFTSLGDLTTTNATLSPTTVNNIEFNPVNSVSVFSVSLGILGDFYSMSLSAVNNNDLLNILQEYNGPNITVHLNTDFNGGVSGQIHDGTPPVTAGASGDPFITPLL